MLLEGVTLKMRCAGTLYSLSCNPLSPHPGPRGCVEVFLEDASLFLLSFIVWVSLNSL